MARQTQEELDRLQEQTADYYRRQQYRDYDTTPIDQRRHLADPPPKPERDGKRGR